MNITDTPPAHVQAELEALSASLDEQVPPKMTDRNLLIATWNIKSFASVTKKWTAGDGDSPKRDFRAVHYITEIISRFDIIAIQEVKGDLRALRYMLKLLNRDAPNWSFLMTDVSQGNAGNNERMAFVFDTRRVSLSGLACELVVAPDDPDIDPEVAANQFARTPYAVGFRAGAHTFILTTLHVDYAARKGGRLQELDAIAKWVQRWAGQERAWSHDLLVLGDFNIDRAGDELYEAFVSTGLTVAPDMVGLRRSLFDEEGEGMSTLRYYDQISWFAGEGGESGLTMEYRGGGNVAFDGLCYGELGLSNSKLQHRVSDHLLLWGEFGR